MNNIEILRKAIVFIAKGPLGNFVSIDNGDYFIQFTPCDEVGRVYIEAVSEQFLPALDGVKPQFKKLGYTLPRQDAADYNYNKDVEVSDVDKLIEEFKYIFENIYKTSFDGISISMNQIVVNASNADQILALPSDSE